VNYLLIGLGFISMHLAEFLSSKNNVKVTYRNLNPVKRVYLETLKDMAIRLDPFRDESLLSEEIRRAEVVVNLAGEITGSKEELKRANTELPELLIKKIAKENREALFIHLSASTYGLTGKVELENPHGYGLKPSNYFEQTKLEGEKAIFKISSQYDLKSAIIRPTLVYGKYNAHSQFVTIYKISKLGLVPKTNINFMPISALSLAKIISKLTELMPKKLYFYASECNQVNVSKFFELMVRALGRKAIKIPIPKLFAKMAMPKEIRDLMIYEGTIYDCSKTEELIGEARFSEKEVIENAKFLRYLEERKSLVPT
jgi:nucleoside-diphosphate-sugar epimerase